MTTRSLGGTKFNDSDNKKISSTPKLQQISVDVESASSKSTTVRRCNASRLFFILLFSTLLVGGGTALAVILTQKEPSPTVYGYTVSSSFVISGNIDEFSDENKTIIRNNLQTQFPTATDILVSYTSASIKVSYVLVIPTIESSRSAKNYIENSDTPTFQEKVFHNIFRIDSKNSNSKFINQNQKN